LLELQDHQEDPETQDRQEELQIQDRQREPETQGLQEELQIQDRQEDQHLQSLTKSNDLAPKAAFYKTYIFSLN